MPIKQVKASQDHNWPRYSDCPQIGPQIGIKQGKKRQKDKWFHFNAATRECPFQTLMFVCKRRRPAYFPSPAFRSTWTLRSIRHGQCQKPDDEAPFSRLKRQFGGSQTQKGRKANPDTLAFFGALRHASNCVFFRGGGGGG